MKCLLFLSDQERYTRAMLKAIDHARDCRDIAGCKMYSKTMGLRVIKRFERVNGCKFDPFNSTHMDHIYGNANHEKFFWSTNKQFERLREEGMMR